MLLRSMSLRRSFGRTFRSIAKAVPSTIAATALALSGLAQAQAPSYGPPMPPNGFPSHYSDGQGQSLSLCLANPAMCLLDTPVADPTPGVAFPANYRGTFPDECFYWVGETSMPTARGGQALLVMAFRARGIKKEEPRGFDEVEGVHDVLEMLRGGEREAVGAEL